MEKDRKMKQAGPAPRSLSASSDFEMCPPTLTVRPGSVTSSHGGYTMGRRRDHARQKKRRSSTKKMKTVIVAVLVVLAMLAAYIAGFFSFTPIMSLFGPNTTGVNNTYGNMGANNTNTTTEK